MRGRHSGSVRSSPMLLRVRAVALDTHRGPRGLPPEHALLVVLDLDLHARRTEDLRGPLELVGGEIVRGHRHDAGRRALDDLHAPDPIGLELARGWPPRPGVRSARGSARCARGRSGAGARRPCSHGLRARRARAPRRGTAPSRPRSAATPARRAARPSPGARSPAWSRSISSVIPESAIRPTISGVPTQIVRWCASESRTAKVPPTAPGPRMATVLVMRALDRRSGSRSSSRNTRPAPRSLPRANPFRNS